MWNEFSSGYAKVHKGRSESVTRVSVLLSRSLWGATARSSLCPEGQNTVHSRLTLPARIPWSRRLERGEGEAGRGALPRADPCSPGQAWPEPAGTDLALQS